MSSTQEARNLLGVLHGAQRIMCMCHRSPDGDAVGAVLGFGQLLEGVFPQKNISFHCVDPVPEQFHFLPGALRIQGPPPMERDALVIFLDCAEGKLTGIDHSHPHLFDGSCPSVSIDHHPTNPRFAAVNIVWPDASSTCEILVRLAQEFHWTLSSDVATCFLNGMYTDTGGLLHSNTSADVYRTVAALLRSGARHQLIVTSVFRTAQLSTLKLWGRVLEKIVVTEEGAALSAVMEEDFRATGASYSELSGAIDYVNAVPGMRFSLVLSERDGKVKGSLRTLRDDVDVSRMASKFRGGGHKKAAGFALQGKLKPELRWRVIEEDAQAR